MSLARTERRAAERRAAKLARHADSNPNPAAAEPASAASQPPPSLCFNGEPDLDAGSEPTPKPPVSDAKLAANRANAQKSTGPRTDAAKALTRHNAVRHGLTGQAILLPTEDAARYQAHCDAYHKELKPVGHFESALVQAIADHDWRLARIPILEANLFALGHTELADPSIPIDLLEAHIQIAYEKHFRNLNIQQNRLTRYRANDLAELKALQHARLEQEKQDYERAAALQQQAEATGQTFHPENFGFVFSTADLAAFREAKSDLHLAKRLIRAKAA